MITVVNMECNHAWAQHAISCEEFEKKYFWFHHGLLQRFLTDFLDDQLAAGIANSVERNNRLQIPPTTNNSSKIKSNKHENNEEIRWKIIVELD